MRSIVGVKTSAPSNFDKTARALQIPLDQIGADVICLLRSAGRVDSAGQRGTGDDAPNEAASGTQNASCEWSMFLMTLLC